MRTLVLPPAVQVVGRQLAATGGWTPPPHARSLPFQPGIPSPQVDKLQGGPLALSSDRAVGLPELLLGGVPRVKGVLPLVPPVATLLVELRELPTIKSDSSWDRAKEMCPCGSAGGCQLPPVEGAGAGAWGVVLSLAPCLEHILSTFRFNSSR